MSHVSTTVDERGVATLLIDHSKFGRRALRKVLDSSQVHTVLTDDGVPESVLSSARDCGCRVVVAAIGSAEE